MSHQTAGSILLTVHACTVELSEQLKFDLSVLHALVLCILIKTILPLDFNFCNAKNEKHLMLEEFYVKFL